MADGGCGGFGPGKKYDAGKTRVDLLPVGALTEVAKVMTFGADKYGANNWQNVRPVRRYYAAVLRHLWARARGERLDPETGLPHLAHAACCVLFMLSIEVGCDPGDVFEPDDPAHESEPRPRLIPQQQCPPDSAPTLPKAPKAPALAVGVRVRDNITPHRHGVIIEHDEDSGDEYEFRVQWDNIAYPNWYRGDELVVKSGAV